MGSGKASGAPRRTAVTEALNHPAQRLSITGAGSVLLNITFGTEEILMDEIMEITDIIQTPLANLPRSSGATVWTKIG